VSPPIQNIYYMLAYSLTGLMPREYANITTEEYDDALEFLSELLIQGISAQLKRGLGRAYVPTENALFSPRGKMLITESVKRNTMMRKQLYCSFDEYSPDYYLNRIVKSTVMMLLGSELSTRRKKALKKLMLYFGEVQIIDLHSINWNYRFNRNNQTYQLLVSTCYLLIHDLLQSTTDGKTRIMHYWNPDRTNLIYQNFLREYYHREYPELTVSAPKVKWQLDDDMDLLLPEMRTDMVLKYGKKSLIIDAKYYGDILSKYEFKTGDSLPDYEPVPAKEKYYDGFKLRSENMYQMFTYVKNYELQMREKEEGHIISGMLLYARTEEKYQPAHTYRMSGNTITAASLDLNCSFRDIQIQMDEILQKEFGFSPRVFAED